eukprot:1063103-Prymnesium_polylepis.1
MISLDEVVVWRAERRRVGPPREECGRVGKGCAVHVWSKDGRRALTCGLAGHKIVSQPARRRAAQLHSVRAKAGRAASVMARVCCNVATGASGCGAAPHVGRDGHRDQTRRRGRRAESKVRKAVCHAKPPPKLLAPRASPGHGDWIL